MLPHKSSIDRRLHGELHMIQWPIWCEHHESSSLLAIGICVFPARCSKSTASPQQPPYFHRRTQKHAGEGQLEMGLSADQEPKRWWIMIPCILLNEVMHATLQKMNKHYSYQKSKLFAARLKLHWNLDPKMEPQKQWWFQDALRPIHAYKYINILILHIYMSCRFQSCCNGASKERNSFNFQQKMSDDNFDCFESWSISSEPW